MYRHLYFFTTVPVFNSCQIICLILFEQWCKQNDDKIKTLSNLKHWENTDRGQHPCCWTYKQILLVWRAKSYSALLSWQTVPNLSDLSNEVSSNQWVEVTVWPATILKVFFRAILAELLSPFSLCTLQQTDKLHKPNLDGWALRSLRPRSISLLLSFNLISILKLRKNV